MTNGPSILFLCLLLPLGHWPEQTLPLLRMKWSEIKSAAFPIIGLNNVLSSLFNRFVVSNIPFLHLNTGYSGMFLNS